MTVARAFATQKLRARSVDGRARICDAETVRTQWRRSRAHLQRRNCSHAVTVARAFATQKLRARSDYGCARAFATQKLLALDCVHSRMRPPPRSPHPRSPRTLCDGRLGRNTRHAKPCATKCQLLHCAVCICCSLHQRTPPAPRGAVSTAYQ